MSNGTIYIGMADRANVSGKVRNGLAAVDQSTGALKPWNPGASYSTVMVWDLAVSNGQVYVAGDFISNGYLPSTHLAAFDATSGADTGWNPNADDIVDALAISGSTIYAGGYFSHNGGQPRNAIAALEASTGLATDWNPDAIPIQKSDGKFALRVSDIAVSGNTLYVGGEFSSIGGLKRNNIAAIDAVTGNATAWNPDADGLVSTLAVSGDSIYVGGRMAIQDREGLVEIDVASGTVTAWNPINWVEDISIVRGIAVGDRSIYAGGLPDYGTIASGLARFDMIDTVSPSLGLSGSSLTISLMANANSGENADWWLVAMTPWGHWYYYVYPDTWVDIGTDLSGVRPAYQGPLGNISSLRLFDVTGIPSGNYVLYFGVDTKMNGILDHDQLYYSSFPLTAP